MKTIAKHVSSILLLLAATGLGTAAHAAVTDIANSPMASSGNTSVKPNVLFILDDSGSMGWEYLPDSVRNNNDKLCYRNHNYNGVYYNPGLTYELPVTSAGTSFANATFVAAKDNGFSASSGTTNLAVGFSTGDDSGGKTAYYYEYTGADPITPVRGTCYANGSYTKRVISSVPVTTITVSGSSNAVISGITVNGVQIMSGSTSSSSTNSTVATRIAANITLNGFSARSSGSTVTIAGPSSAATYTPVATVSSGSATLTPAAFSSPTAAQITEAQNFANWYSYYRNRMLTMKSAAGLAFKDIGSNFRVGFTTIGYTGVSSADNRFLKINDFAYVGDGTGQKEIWYDKLYITGTPGATPLRGALSKAGRIYAGQLLTGADDPVQYSCQQNFTILSTDGYWNTNDEETSSPKYGPYKIDNNTLVGQQDGAGTARPMNDGESALKSTSQITETQTQVSQSTSQVQKRTEQIQSRTSNLQQQTSQLQEDVGFLQSRTSQLQTRMGTLQGTVSQIMMRCNNTAVTCGSPPADGVPNANWSLVTSGSCTTAANVQCAVGSLSTVANVATTCNTAGSISSSTAPGSVTITFENSNSARIDRIRADGTISKDIWSAKTTASNDNNIVASRVAAEINACTASKTGSCDVSGHSATVSENVVTVSGPNITSGFSVRVANGSATVTIAYTAGATTYTLNNADSNGKVYSACSYAWGGWADASSCTVSKSTASPYTITSATECQYAAWSAWADAGSCTPLAQDGSSPHTVGTAMECQHIWSNAQGTPSCSIPTYVAGVYSTPTVFRNCQTVITSPYANAASCTTSAVPDGSGNTTQCQYTAWSAWANAASCTPLAQTAGSPYTVGTATDCQTTDTGWVGASSCAPGVSGGQTITCQTIATGPTLVAACAAAGPAAGNNWTQTTCTPTTVVASHGVASCTAEAPVAGNGFTTTSCNTVTTGPAAVATCTAEAASGANNWTTTTCAGGSGGISDTLADVAMYYYKTDLRTSALGNCTGALGAGVDVCENNVPGSGDDISPQQHMTTFTLGLGVDGTLGYADNYQSSGSADYNAIKQGTKDWPDPISNSGAERIDDLWHAAVNGRGVYYSARDPGTLVSGISNALAGVTSRAGSAAAAATSNLEPVAGDNFLFIALYRTVFWDGDLQAKTIDPVTGAVSSATIWTAQPLLDLRVGASTDTRTIYTFDSANTNGNYLMEFNWTNVGGTGYFDNMCSPTSKLSQCPALTGAEQTAASGANLVNFLRGQNGNEGTLYRDRDHVLGDMVTSQPVYVKKPPFEYADSGYSTFRDTTRASRAPMVYVAANDGMLHAFYAESGKINTTTGDAVASAGAGVIDVTGGDEAWSYVPPMVMSNLYRLADKTYSVNHRYYVDGSPTVADICPNAPASTCTGAQWKSILVGGFNAGGRGYYALDVTNPAAPKALWNFTEADDNDMGYSFGNPIVTKRKDGTWVVVVTSGYNNVSPGSGQGYLFVLNAATGAVLEKIGTGVGNTTTPSGLAKINVWVDVSTDNTAERFYGGDLLGNLWRFELDSATPPGVPVSTAGATVLLAELGATQPITTRPELTIVPYGAVEYTVVQFGTGRYLGLSDLSNTDQQTIYALKDNLSGTGLGAVHSNGVLVQQTLSNFTGSSGEQLRTTSTNSVDWTNKSGWYVDLNPANSSPGERVNVDVQLQLGSLTVATNVPSDNACNVGGYSFLYNFDFRTGQYLQTAALNAVGARLTSNAMVAGMNTIRLQSGKIITIITDTAGGITSQETPTAVASSGTAKRVSWRELIQ